MKRMGSLFMLWFFTLSCVLAQQAQQGADDTDKLVKATQNPVASLISVPFQNNLNYPIGPFARYQNVLNIQPVIPVGNGQWNLITRAILPVMPAAKQWEKPIAAQFASRRILRRAIECFVRVHKGKDCNLNCDGKVLHQRVGHRML